MLDWLDGRNSSSFGSISWSGNTLAFTVSVGAGANGLQAVVPATSTVGPITGITRNGSPVSYTTQTLKGVSYAMFGAAAGSYQVVYSVDSVPPAISALTAAPADTDRDRDVDHERGRHLARRLRYLLGITHVHGIKCGSDHKSSRGDSTGLTPGTQYFYRATSADAAGNSATSPATAAAFTTTTPPPPGALTLSDTTAADFNAGALTPGLYVSETANGEVILAPTAGAEFSGTTLPIGWSAELVEHWRRGNGREWVAHSGWGSDTYGFVRQSGHIARVHRDLRNGRLTARRLRGHAQ